MDRKEFEKSVTRADAAAFWAGLSREEILTLLGPEAARMVGFDQNNPHHCYDLFGHVLRVVDGVRPEVFPGRPDAFALTRAAAFFHDIGKPDTAREKDGRTVFYGHAVRSAAIAKRLLGKMGYDTPSTARVCFLAAHHDDFISFRLPGEWRGRGYGRVIDRRDVAAKQSALADAAAKAGLDPADWTLWAGLMELCRADAAAQAWEVWLRGYLIDTRQRKLQRMDAIRRELEALRSA